MRRVPLGEFMVTRAGSVTPSTFPDERFDLFSIPAHDMEGFEEVRGAEVGSAKQLVQPGDVMISKIVPHIRRARVVSESRGCRQIASGEWILFRGEEFDSNYLRHYLLSDQFHSQFMSTVAGVGGSLLRARPAQVKGIQVPLPNMSEQRRIAAILDQADALRAKRHHSLEFLDFLPSAVFCEMFAERAWEVGTVGAAAEVQGGLQVTAKRKSLPLDSRYLRVANVYRNRLDLTEVKSMRVTQAELQRTRLIYGDVLVVEGHGNPNEIGRAAMWTNAIDECVHQNHLIRIRFDRSKILPEFGLAWLNSTDGRRHLLRAAKTTSGLNTISTSNVKAAPMPVVSVDEQQRFVAHVTGAKSCARPLAQSVQELDRLFVSLQSRFFDHAA